VFYNLDVPASIGSGQRASTVTSVVVLVRLGYRTRPVSDSIVLPRRILMQSGSGPILSASMDVQKLFDVRDVVAVVITSSRYWFDDSDGFRE